MKKLWAFFKIYLIACGLLVNIFVLWMIVGWPIGIDKALIVSEKPVEANYIICLTGGLSSHNLPTEDGWGRVYAACQLYFDGLGKKILFTGGGTQKVAEAEVYAEAASWLGCPKEDILFEPGSARTSDHPRKILGLKDLTISPETALNIVTSALHSRRVALCFKKAGFSRFRVVTSYVAQKASLEFVRERRVSQFPEYRPSGRRYDDVFMRLRTRSAYFFNAWREVCALLWYKIKGYI